MIYDCPTCTAALRFNPTLNKLECLSCGNKYDISEFENKESTDVVDTVTTETNGETMECNIYSCTACGAELAVNGVESSTFCAYCGQPTIVFSRVSSTLKPRYIIPFSVPKEQAVDSIRKHLSKGSFVPDEIKNFEVERVRGIYVPFFLYNMKYRDKQHLKGTVKQGKSSVTKYYYRNAECSFHDITMDASKQLNDDSSQRLEPYDLSAMVPFEASYLSGFYADCYDMTKNEMDSNTCSRIKKLFDREVIETVNASNVQIITSNPQYQITRSDYAMFPAWFMTFRYENEPYTILVNGQTGKVIGAVPYHKPKVTTLFVTLGIIASFIATFFAHGMLRGTDEIGEAIGVLCAIAFVCYASGARTFKRYKESIKLSKSTTMNDFVKDRQEGN